MTTSLVCTVALHEALKRDEAAWKSLPCIGYMPEFDDNGDEVPGLAMEGRNCHCKSTLWKVVRRG